MKTSPVSLAILALLASSASYAILSVTTRLLSLGFSDLTQIYLRLALGTILAWLVFRKNIRRENIRTTSRRDWLILLAMGILGYSVCVYFLTLGVLHTTLLNVSVFLATVPFFAYLYSFFLFRTPITGKIIALLLVSLFGVSIIASKSFIPSLSSFGIGEVYLLLASATLAVYSVGRKMLSPHLTTSEVTVIVLAIATVTSFILAILKGETLNLQGFTMAPVIFALVLAALLNIVTSQTENFAFRIIDPVLGTQILLTENLFSPLLGYFLYREVPSFPELIGAVLIIGSIAVANTGKNIMQLNA